MSTTVTTIKVDLVDPHPKQPPGRAKRGVAELAESIKRNGLLQPLIVSKDGERYRIVGGHRRLEAVKLLGDKTVDARVFESESAAAEYSAAMAENTAREPYTAGELAAGTQTLLDLGVERTEIAKTLGVDEATIEKAAAVGSAAKKVIKDTEQTHASLDEAAALAEFAGVKESYETLKDSVGSPRFAHVLERERQEREGRAKAEAARAELKAAGITVIDHLVFNKPGTESLMNLGIDEAKHRACPGHAVYVSSNGRIVPCCTKAKLHHGKGTVAQPLSPAEKARRQSMREIKKAWKAADAVRARHLLAGALRKPTKGMVAFAADVIYVGGFDHYMHSIVRKRADEMIASVGRSIAPEAKLFACAAAMVEKDLAATIQFGAGLDPSKYDRTHNRVEYARYYAVLEECGYVLAECEQTLVAQALLGEDAPVPPTLSARWEAIANGEQSGVMRHGDQTYPVRIRQDEIAEGRAGFRVLIDGREDRDVYTGTFELARLAVERRILELVHGEPSAPDAKTLAAGERPDAKQRPVIWPAQAAVMVQKLIDHGRAVSADGRFELTSKGLEEPMHANLIGHKPATVDECDEAIGIFTDLGLEIV